MNGQDRAILDQELPDELVLEALADVSQTYNFDGTVLSSHDAFSGAGEHLSAVDVARRFGGSIIEEVEEYGSTDVLKWKTTRR